MFFYIVFTPISTTSGLWSTGNTRKYHQIDVYIYQCELTTSMIVDLYWSLCGALGQVWYLIVSIPDLCLIPLLYWSLSLYIHLSTSGFQHKVQVAYSETWNQSLQPVDHRLGKGWALVWDVFLCFCHFPMSCPGSGVVLDRIDSWSLPSFLLVFDETLIEHVNKVSF